MNSLYLGATSETQGWLKCREYCTTVAGSNFFTYKPGNSVSAVDHFFREMTSYKVFQPQYCLCWSNCEKLSTSECPSCISGEICSDDCFVPNARYKLKLAIAADISSPWSYALLESMEYSYLWMLPLMLRNVQRSAMLVGPANGLLMTTRISLVSSQKTNDSSLIASPVHMGTIGAFRREPLV